MGLGKTYSTKYLVDSNGNTGAVNQVLVSTATGVDWVDGSGSGIIGGPYLPLSAGASYPLTGDLTVDGGSITVDPDAAGAVFTWKESDSTTVAGQLRGYANRGDIYLYSDGIKKTELSSQTDSFIPALHIGGTTAASGGGLQVTGQGIFTGNVGIGTTSPSAKLQVLGTAEDNQIVGAGVTSVTEITNSYVAAFGRLSELIFSTSTGGGTNRLSAISSAYTGWNAAGLSGDLRFSTRTVGDSALSEKMVITSSGNVGIGTASPETKLDVRGQLLVAGDTPVARIGSTLEVYRNGTTAELSIHQDDSTVSSSLFSQLRFRNGGNDTYFKVPQSGNGLIIDVEGKTNAFVIDISGNVGIGTTSPGAKLDIVDSNPFITIQGDSSSYANAGVQFISNHASTLRAMGNFYYSAHSDVEWFSGTPYNNNDSFVINRNTGYTTPSSQSSPPGIGASSGTKFIINSSGNVGIGVTSPGYKLDVNGDVNVPFGASTGYRINGNRTLSQVSGAFELGVLDYKTTYPNISFNNDNTFRVQQNGSTRIIVNSSGNVGIGTTSPDYKLHVAGEAGIELFNSSGGGDVLNFRPSLGDAQKYNMSISSYDHSGSGTGAADGLSINGKDGVSIATGTDTTRTERMRITSTGNVGIGTGSPGHPLDVVGNLNISNDYLIGGISVISNSATYTNLHNPEGAIGLYIGDSTDRSNYYDNNYHYFRTAGGGSSYGVWNSTGLGIGTTSPASKLNVAGNGRFTGSYLDVGHGLSTAEAALSIGNSRTDNGYAYIDLIGDTTYTDYALRIIRGNAGPNAISQINHRGTGDFEITTTDAANITFDTASLERLRITSSGNVGIGRSSSITARLFVEGPVDTSTISTSSTPAARINNGGAISNWIGSNGYNYGYIQSIQDDGSNNLKPLSLNPLGGNVGIGTVSPSEKLEISTGGGVFNPATIALTSNNDGAAVAGSYMFFKDNTSVKWQIGKNVAQDFIIYDNTANGNKFRIVDNGNIILGEIGGNVGIATTSPGAKLDVYNSTNNVYQAFIGGSVSKLMINGNLNGGGVALQSAAANSSSNYSICPSTVYDLLMQSCGGNVMIGSGTPTAKLEVNGQTKTKSLTYLEPTGNSEYRGEIVYFGAFEAGIFDTDGGELVCLGTGSGSPVWRKADDNTATRATGMLGITLGSTVASGVLVRGFARSAAYNGFADGGKCYISATDGDMTTTATTGSNKYLRIVGYVVDSITGAAEIYFCPDNTYVQIA